MPVEQTFTYLLKTYQGTKDLESSTLSGSARNLAKGSLRGGEVSWCKTLTSHIAALPHHLPRKSWPWWKHYQQSPDLYVQVRWLLTDLAALSHLGGVVNSSIKSRRCQLLGFAARASVNSLEACQGNSRSWRCSFHVVVLSETEIFLLNCNNFKL